LADELKAAFAADDVVAADDFAAQLYVGRSHDRPAVRKAKDAALAKAGLRTGADIAAKIVRPVWERALRSADAAALRAAVQTIAVWEDCGVYVGGSSLVPSLREIASSNILPAAAKREAFSVLRARGDAARQERKDAAEFEAWFSKLSVGEREALERRLTVLEREDARPA
jgi:hypothetical protein